MKKIFLRTLSSISILLLFLCINPIKASAISPSDIIIQLSEKDNNDFICIEDESWSMQNTFRYESAEIAQKLDNLAFSKYIAFGNNSSSNIWETLNQYDDNNNIVLVSDLWNTDSEHLDPSSDKTIIIMVPYTSNFTDSVNHIEDVVSNVFLQTWTNSTIHVYYLDDIVFSYSNSANKELEYVIDKPISDEQVAENTAISITEEVLVDESIPRDSIIVFDISGSMYEFMNMLYNQLQEMTTTQKIETMYAFATEVSDEISPEDFNENLWHSLYFSLGGTSNIIGGLRKATQNSSTAHIYLITDLQNNENEWQTADENFSGLISVIEYRSNTYSDNEYSDCFFESINENYPNAESITRIQAN